MTLIIYGFGEKETKGKFGLLFEEVLNEHSIDEENVNIKYTSKPLKASIKFSNLEDCQKIKEFID